ncbi:hypothetical protein Oweho_1436 [Owenweeksia hongkongensis DSM 17368]|uniref:STAS/SEC14 domain-containing protein n=1 Tax=Owenweeksia hongkongensis (strain DSM 17368 / CIP 108786 / JCM 12287 / NRRL B-23963 / UST20020801) TaxID=926562 RepID=G8R864_OWEHD|nr:hypothetical protein [Owenweeksia hongkongensis]AEV32432.1 hypothetical protein Oweho_1436 [Owenweeksia hongkongensis DSM 17368]
MKHVFRILPEHKLIIELCGSSFGLDDYIEFKKREITHPDFNPEYDILSDLRCSNFTVPAKDVHKMVTFFKESIRLDIDRKGCLLTLEPLQTAYSMLFEKHMTDSIVTWKVCTTEVEALSWLHYPLSLTKLEEILEELKSESLM